MSTETIGQAQMVERSIVGTIGQADGSVESPNANEIRESAMRVARIAVGSQGARWIEGFILLTNPQVPVSRLELDREVRSAIAAMQAVSEAECEEVATRMGL